MQIFRILKKRAIKCINQDLGSDYTLNNQLYYVHCKQLNILRVRYLFDFHDLIVHNVSCIQLPTYLHLSEHRSRRRFTHLDHLSITTDIVRRQSDDTNSKRGFKNV